MQNVSVKKAVQKCSVHIVLRIVLDVSRGAATIMKQI